GRAGDRWRTGVGKGICARRTGPSQSSRPSPYNFIIVDGRGVSIHKPAKNARPAARVGGPGPGIAREISGLGGTGDAISSSCNNQRMLNTCGDINGRSETRGGSGGAAEDVVGHLG